MPKTGIVVLVGGRGRRLGPAGSDKHKAVFHHWGKPLLHHVLEMIIQATSTETITLLTGYRSGDIRTTVELVNWEQNVSILDFTSVRGTLSRLAAAVPCLKMCPGYLVCGIDTLVPPAVLKNFWEYITCACPPAALLLSTDIHTAPTHKMVTAKNNLVTHYDTNQNKCSDRLLCDVGIRFFSYQTLLELREYAERQKKKEIYIPEFISNAALSHLSISALVFSEPWEHFAYPEDFAPQFP